MYTNKTEEEESLLIINLAVIFFSCVSLLLAWKKVYEVGKHFLIYKSTSNSKD